MRTQRVGLFGAVVGGALLALSSIAFACVPGMGEDITGTVPQNYEQLQAQQHAVSGVAPIQNTNAAQAPKGPSAAELAAAAKARADAQAAANAKALADAKAAADKAAADAAAAAAVAPAAATVVTLPDLYKEPIASTGGGSSPVGAIALGAVVGALAVGGVLAATRRNRPPQRRPQRRAAVADLYNL